MKIVIAEPLRAAGIDILKAQPGWEIITSSPTEYQRHLPDAEVLLASRTGKVTAAQIETAKKLRVIAFPGVGTDFVDLDAATSAGILVMNMPGESAVAVAEHTLGLMLAMARQIPQAIESTRRGRWEGKKFLGTELRRKTLGVIGLGSIGREVVRRARGFEMKIVANDPYVNSEAAADLGVTLVSREELYAQADYITLHVALTTETMGMLNEETFAKMKRGVRIVNCARGELVDVVALRHAIESGKVAGAALDVLQTEPPEAGEPLLAMDQVLATPHIGGSTEEAAELIAVRLAEHLIEYFNEGVAVNAVNVPAMSEEAYRAAAPYAILAERLGTFAAHVATANPKLVRLVYHGNFPPQNTRLLRNAGLAGVLSRSLAVKANVVNALKLAADRGLSYAERFERPTGHMDTLRIELETDKGVTSVEGAIVMDRPRLLAVDGIRCEATLAGHLLFLTNEDLPGVLGYIGTVTGKGQVNIAALSLGRQEKPDRPGAPLTAITLIETDQPVPEPVIAQLLENKAVRIVRGVEFRP
ncbi:MAG: phosphoglycerate dehydrogenase [Acidobacteriota bacterium]|nr:phosphoglycerate dehydrogenase [Acidobacteriota bacterium]